MAAVDAHGFDEFVRMIEALRGPGGCPWDQEQTHESIAKNVVEEAYEVVHAIELGDVAELREELGDVLLQVVLQSQIAVGTGGLFGKGLTNGTTGQDYLPVQATDEAFRVRAIQQPASRHLDGIHRSCLRRQHR